MSKSQTLTTTAEIMATMQIVPHTYKGSKYKNLEEAHAAKAEQQRRAYQKFKENHPDYSKERYAKEKAAIATIKISKETDVMESWIRCAEELYKLNGQIVCIAQSDQNKQILFEALSKLDMITPP